MLTKTKGIVLRFVRYKETSVIATIYTQREGVVSVIANSVRSKTSSGKIALFQPISLVELVIYFNPLKNINRISEIKNYHPLHALRQDPIKSTITIFLTEVLNKCLKEEVGNTPMYTFIEEAIIFLNEQPTGFQDFHLFFLIKLSQYLGFKPASVNDFSDHITNKAFYKDAENSKIAENLLTLNLGSSLSTTNNIRQIILSDLLEYYQNHMELGKLKSLEILHELLHS